MIRNRIIGIILSVAIGYGGVEGYEFTIENYGDTEVILEDGTTYNTKEIVKHPTKVFKTRDIEGVEGVVWHHAAWNTQDINKIADWHVKGNQWAGIGYHGAIKKDGTYLILNSLETLSYHSAGSNTKYIGICFLSNAEEDKLTDNQIKTAKLMLEGFCEVLDINQSVGHRDVRATTCPGDAGYKQLKEEQIIF